MSTPSSTTTALDRPGAARRPPLAARLVVQRLARLASGSLTVVEDGRRTRYGDGDPAFPAAEVRVQDPRFWRAVLLRGSIGAGEAWGRGWWSSDDPTAVVRLFVRNRSALEGLRGGVALLSRPLLSLWQALRPNTLRGARANVRAHYDVSNEFFRLFLDDTLTYSCGLFERPAASLREASVAKIDRLCRKLELAPGDRLLEIGTGWGSFALHAAREYGCRVTTTTISREQHALARERVRAAGLEDRVTLLLEDYRRLQGRFDKLVSVEMVEAIGHRQLPEFFRRCASLLEPDGRMALQAITIADAHYDRARRSVDFIRRHVFPGSCIPSVTALLSAATRASDLRLVHMEDIGPHYARTLAIWRENLHAHRDEARALGFDDETLRLWEFYFAYCEGSFAERHLGDAQMLFVRPDARAEPLLPPLGGEAPARRRAAIPS